MLIYFTIIITVSMSVMGVILCIAALAITKVDTPEHLLIPLTTILITLSSFLGSFILSKLFRENGLLVGSCVSAVFTVMILIMSFAYSTFNISGLLFSKLAAVFTSGILGGILGVNSQ